MYDNVCEDVLDDSVSVEACIEKYCSSLAYDEKFRAYLRLLDLTINVEPEEEEPIETENDYIAMLRMNQQILLLKQLQRHQQKISMLTIRKLFARMTSLMHQIKM